MKIKYKTQLDYLELDFYKNMQFVFLGDNFPWYLKKETDLRDVKKDYFFTHIIYQNNIAHSSFYNFVQLNLLNFMRIQSLIFVKAIMLPSNKDTKLIEIQNEFDFSHKQAIYFVNTNNGNILLQDGTKIKSKENCLLLTESSNKYISENCTDVKAKVIILVNYF